MGEHDYIRDEAARARANDAHRRRVDEGQAAGREYETAPQDETGSKAYAYKRYERRIAQADVWYEAEVKDAGGYT
jgi:hypothetical protein